MDVTVVVACCVLVGMETRQLQAEETTESTWLRKMPASRRFTLNGDCASTVVVMVLWEFSSANVLVQWLDVLTLLLRIGQQR